jgi:nucleoid-associated protein YgaU
VATAEPASPPTAESVPEAEDVVEPRPATRSKTQRSRKARTTPKVVPAAPSTALPATPTGQAKTPAPPAATPPAVVPAPAAAAVAPRAARAARGWHVIQRGESLWSIAAERLGSGASTAGIAAEVERLWALNQDRIGTGDRNVVLAGTKIKV